MIQTKIIILQTISALEKFVLQECALTLEVQFGVGTSSVNSG